MDRRRLMAGGAVGAAAALAVLFVVLWLISLAIHDVSIVDPVWGPAFVVVAAVCLIVGDAVTGESCARRWLLLALTAIWGLRLGGYLIARKRRDPGEDRRYTAMRERRGGGGSAALGAAFQELDRLVARPSVEHTVEAEKRIVKSDDERGGE